MAPLPQEYAQATDGTPLDQISDDDVVISGVSALMPNCDSFQEFSERLYNKENMTTKQKDRWALQHPELKPFGGFIRGLDRFDAQFFSVHAALSHDTEPGSRKMFEHAYQAIYDAGLSTSDVSGKNIASYAMATICDSENIISDTSASKLIGNSRAMFANRISYCLNLRGPSITMECGSAGTLLGLQKGYDAIKKSGCEAAIVASGKLVLHPQLGIMQSRTLLMNNDGKTKCYDAAADGQTLSEAITVMFLQKFKDAKRVYAVLKHAKTEIRVDFDQIFQEPEPIARNPGILGDFFRTFYEQAGVSPSSVEYVEGYGAAIPEIDKVELQALEQVFCKDRKRPLLVGSVTSNIGFTDAVSGACSIMKILLGYQRGELAATIHCDNPRQDIAALRDGRMKIVTDHSRFDCSYTAVNALSITGVQGHALLHGFRKPKDLNKYRSDIPYLIAASGRQESAVQRILDDIGSRPLDPEEIALIHGIYKTGTTKHLARGFGIYSNKDGKTGTHYQKVEYYDEARKPLWFVYSGMGSQWVGMGKHLMRIPVFAASMGRCHKVLEPKGVDLINIITSEDMNIFDNILHSFVAISAFQIALTDLLATIGLVPDKVVGHSLGELGCAYADGCFSVEEVMMLSYVRGYVSVNSKLDHGLMAAVGLGYKQLSKICPPEIDIACHNNSTSSTISGPCEVVQEFLDRLTADGIFAKAVESSNIAYHSRYIAGMGPEFLRLSLDVVKSPKLRTERWVSSSVPVDKWDEPNAMYSSAEYHTHNLLNTVLFEEALRFIPAHALLVEIAPHSLLQAILKRALPNCNLAPLTRRAHPDGALCLLEGIGNIYMAGYNPDISALYPKVEFPVSTGTRPLSHLVEWMHEEKWMMGMYHAPMRRNCSVFKQFVTVEDDDYEYLKGHYIEGTRVIPFAAGLVAAWDTLAMTMGHERRGLSVKFHEVKFHCQPVLEDRQLTNLVATVQRGSGHFEVFDGNAILVEGTITPTCQKTGPNAYQNDDKKVTKCLGKDDIYKLLFERGYDYRGQFRSIHSIDLSMTHAQIEWQDNWVTFIDAVLQMHALRSQHTWVSQPKALRSLVIDVKKNLTETLCSNLIEATYEQVYDRTRCGGIMMQDLQMKNQIPSKRQLLALQTLKFVPFETTDNIDISTAINTVMQIITENRTSNKITVIYVNVPKMHDHVDKIKKIMQVLPEIELNIITVKKEEILEYKAAMGKPDVVFMHDLLSERKMFEVLYHTLPSNTFLISVGLDAKNKYPSTIYRKVSAFGSGGSRVELARFKPTPAASNTTAITVRNSSDMHQLKTTCELLPPQHKLLVLAPHPTPSGLKEQVKIWRKNNHKNVAMVMFDQNNALNKELDSIPDMAFSVLNEKGVWGGEYYMPMKLDPPPPKGVVSLTCSHPGNLDSLSWVGLPEPTNDNGIEVTVQYAGLVGYDAARAQGIGLASVEGGFGMDFSGVTARGERVMGLMARGSASSKVRVNPRLLWPVPDHWTMEDAATVPFAYCYALYLLTRVVNPSRGMSILIHGGSGALGQALISVSLAFGLEVYATVSDIHKKHFLKKLFPELKSDHIGNSRDHTFKYILRTQNLKSGADIVVTSTRGKLKDIAVNSCGWIGYVIDTSQVVTNENYNLGMMTFHFLISYCAVDFSSHLTDDNEFELAFMQSMLSEGILKGYVRPLTRVTYQAHEVPRAFRLLAAARHRGRVLLSLDEAKPVVLPRISCPPASSHVVIYEDEEYGLQLADLLVRRGARRLLLHGKQTPYLNYKIHHWNELGVHVEVSSSNLFKKAEVLSMLLQSIKMGAVDGIYMVTHPEQKADDTVAILSNLDSTSRKVCPGLRYFTVISKKDGAWREIVNERARDGLLPSLSLMLPQLNELATSGSPELAPGAGLRARACLQAVESALLGGERVVAAHAQPVSARSVLEELADIPGVNITNATVDRTRLEQVGVDDGRAHELSHRLQERFRITVAPELVPSMTIGQLKRLQRAPPHTEGDATGFGAYVTTVDPDQMRATSEVVLMNTLTERCGLRSDEFIVGKDTLCIIPGLEGHHGRFSSLCERLKLSAAVFQLGHDRLTDSLQEMAQRLADSIIKYVAPQQTFYLLGYEFGVLLALEVAAIFEGYGMTGTVYLLGGTPEDIRSTFEARWQDAGEDAMQDALIRQIHHIICRSDSLKLDELLPKCKNWPEKVKAMVKVLQEKVSYSIQYMTGIADGIYKRIQLLRGYDAQPYKLRSKIVLLQSKPHNATVQSLKPYTSQEPVVKHLQAPLAYALQDLSAPNIINSHLDKKVIDLYNASNHCNTVLMNPKSFIKNEYVDFD